MRISDWSSDVCSSDLSSRVRPRTEMRQALVFGASGQIGRPLLVRLGRRGWQVLAVSRREQPAIPGVRWLRGDLETAGGLPPCVDAIFSCGPLDHFARWYAQSPENGRAHV